MSELCRSVIGEPLLGLHVARGDSHGPIIDFTDYGVPMIGFLTMEDRDYPVELARDHASRLLGARICLSTEHELYRRSFDCPNGLFPVEVFEWRDPERDGSIDRLGIRVRFGDRSALEHPGRSRVPGRA